MVVPFGVVNVKRESADPEHVLAVLRSKVAWSYLVEGELGFHPMPSEFCLCAVDMYENLIARGWLCGDQNLGRLVAVDHELEGEWLNVSRIRLESVGGRNYPALPGSRSSFDPDGLPDEGVLVIGS